MINKVLLVSGIQQSEFSYAFIASGAVYNSQIHEFTVFTELKFLAIIYSNIFPHLPLNTHTLLLRDYCKCVGPLAIDHRGSVQGAAGTKSSNENSKQPLKETVLEERACFPGQGPGHLSYVCGWSPQHRQRARPA